LQRLGVADLCHVHHENFQAVHPWAGQVRTSGQVTAVAGFPSADPARIQGELELLLFQFRELLERAIPTSDRLGIGTALAFFHVRFERVHPFLDGNGRSGRTLLAVQFERLFGLLPRFTDQPGYRIALRASASRDLAPLINYLGSAVGLIQSESPVPPPFRIYPRFLEETSRNSTFEEDLAWSREVR
jgi:fido (protein-threonine AMPylation protein)